MLEFFRAILDAVLAITPKALTARKDARLNALGAELFVLYLRAHRIADNGDYLLGFLENTATMSEEDVRVQTSWVRRLRCPTRAHSGSSPARTRSPIPSGAWRVCSPGRKARWSRPARWTCGTR